MDSQWEKQFRRRMLDFGAQKPSGPTSAVSIKVRVASGCFHREHSPKAYALIDSALQDSKLKQEAWEWHEHESGPEILVWVSATAAVASLTAAVINIVAAIIKARSEGIKLGDHPREPIELIMRTHETEKGVIEERILRFSPEDVVNRGFIARALHAGVRKLLTPRRTKKRKPAVKRAKK